MFHGLIEIIGLIDMIKYLFLIISSFLLSSCFSYYDKAERLYVIAYLDGKKEALETYELVYLFDGDTVAFSGSNYNENFMSQDDGHLMIIDRGFCNAMISAREIFGFGNTLRGRVLIEIFLRNKKNGNSFLLAKKQIDMNAYFRSTLKTQVFFGSDTTRYIVRSGANIDWRKAKLLVMNDFRDSVYHYTAWYWDKRKECDENISKEKCIVEIP